MMTSLFSMFDPSGMVGSINYLAWLVLLILVGPSVWLCSPPIMMVSQGVNKMLWGELKLLGSNLAVVALGLVVALSMVNLLGLFAYVFTPTSHFIVPVCLGLSMWLASVCWQWWKSWVSFLSKLLPVSTPAGLWVLLVLVEGVSLLIRPLTLSIRLVANMVAGHLLLSLVGGSVGISVGGGLAWIAQWALMGLEIGVALVQAMVFTMLLVLYSSE